ncbi:single-stranded DNA-binding protein [Hoyosella altamirensis]|uniref:single-stranded DNA-binding protein n=1 Tax=Hoyosella altamirensis TaxID=616997 RepID=UPI0007DB3D7C|nr:single-stranded DNA-binding protein [Hoyosella altamirensis]
MSLGHFAGIGRLVADPELRVTPQGKSVASFTIAFSERVKDERTGEWEDGRKEFVRCTAWGQIADNLCESLTKGVEVIVSGRRYTRDYVNKQGEQRTSIEMQVDSIGPNLKFQTATVQKPQRDQTSQQQTSSSDPWGTTPAAQDEEPPF